ncbi:MAG TPA: DUF1499 domain-containing protein [Stellaceae bacterium]|jgi:uncharacterized protein (DUF1499 family)|nr:DUF1499 domain-containing protein [Stellaceae bacterium]
MPFCAFGLAIVAMVLLAAGPLGWRLGWWHFRFAFSTLMPWSGYCGIAAVVAAVLALAVGRRLHNRRQVAIGAFAFVVGALIAYVPWHYEEMRGTVPSIDDITTDWVNPPQFQAVLPVRKAADANSVDYKGTKVSDLQRKAYPDIAPLNLNIPPPQAFARALAVAERMEWTIVASDAAAGQIEASQSSRWFGFTDDIVVRITPTDSGSRIDMRSESRYGRGDFGVNAARIRKYLAALQDAAKGG